MEFELTKNISAVNDENEASNYQLAEIDERCPQCDEKEVTMPISHVIMTQFSTGSKCNNELQSFLILLNCFYIFNE